jgi:hypothetical protein|eukprot:COSAG06_NODE_1211_length_10245_cov_5.120244_7_plen_71_part_00
MRNGFLCYVQPRRSDAAPDKRLRMMYMYPNICAYRTDSSCDRLNRTTVLLSAVCLHALRGAAAASQGALQ